uniref:Uncharacterized protein n=1 Tax=Oryza nivara TaxID=4536 RepID=A0A0E0HZI0_ORYNI
MFFPSRFVINDNNRRYPLDIIDLEWITTADHDSVEYFRGARYLEDEKPLKSYAHPMLENLDKEGLLEQLLQSAALLNSPERGVFPTTAVWAMTSLLVCPRKSCEAFGELIDIDFVGGCSCGLGAGEVTARVEGVGGAGQQCPSCAVDKCKEELSRFLLVVVNVNVNECAVWMWGCRDEFGFIWNWG